MNTLVALLPFQLPLLYRWVNSSIVSVKTKRIYILICLDAFLCCSSFQLFKNKRKPSQEETDYIVASTRLIEVIYDPYLTWRNFLRGEFADHRRTGNVVPLHVELVPFIYGIFWLYFFYQI